MTPALDAMAREAGGSVVDYDDPQCSIGDMAFDAEAIVRFAALVRAQALEEAARVCVSTYPEWSPDDGDLQKPCFDTPAECAAAIRALPLEVK